MTTISVNFCPTAQTMRLKITVPGGVKFWCYVSNPSMFMGGTTDRGCIMNDNEESYGVEWDENEVHIYNGIETTMNFTFSRNELVTSIEDFLEQWRVATRQYNDFFDRYLWSEDEGLVDQPYSDNE
jgi:hypothetical protein